ncbi:putative lipid II flippase FtsW [Salimicrobium halophilum]|uniref:Probable peptidoglycan glycosyltransferase FtsW n=1 Tax=Salimicrobium halophilum TaxID=86666 RepID=A0A1G8QHR5_9BACI|nr:putative lipid II flippase FtsW [Salimicrobium halophilum]SDJ04188.1 cell division-specific peptidoglycan biosynthesis regulator FtsW [Salimicrobium halophilum]
MKRWKSLDFTLMFAPLVLIGFGSVMIYSASMVDAPVKFDVEPNHFLMKQLQWAVIGLVIFLTAAFIPYRQYRRFVKLTVLVMLVSLLGLFVFGETRNGATSWYVLGGMSIQPAEFVKIGLILYLASVYAKKQSYIENFTQGVLPPLYLTALLLGLIIFQPDIGTAAVIAMIAASVVISSGIKVKHMLILISGIFLVIILAAQQMNTAERSSRFTGAYQPFETPESDGYHLIQSYISIGTGGWTGQGLGQGVQKLGYLPEPHTDFIMAVIAEELGFIGVVVTLGLLALIVLRGLYIAKKCEDAFGSLLAIGISSMIAIQAIINLGAMSGLLPITGVPLPFVSYGGSALLIFMLAVGMLNSVARGVHYKEEKETKEAEPAPPKKQSYTTSQGVKSWQN